MVFTISAVQEALASEESNRILLIDYENLCKQPANQLLAIYDFLEIVPPTYYHNFDNVEYEAEEFDQALGAKGLHTVKGKVEWKPRTTILPQKLFNEYNSLNFWR